jgi:uncharacterized SAM-binding protein YcdF (DUF218 family)
MALSLLAQIRELSRLALASNLIAVAILWFAGTSIFTEVLVLKLELRNVPSAQIPYGDAIVVLGGVTGKAYSPQPVPHLKQGSDRLVYAASLYKAGKAPLVIFSANGSESADMAEVMELMGVPRAAMVEEDGRLRDTYGTARDLNETLVSRHVHKILLVTSAIRMPRAVAVFQHFGLDVVPAPTDFLTASAEATSQPLNLLCAVIPNLGDLDAFTAA